MEEEKVLRSEITRLKDTLDKKVAKFSLESEEILELSQELDKLIIRHTKIKCRHVDPAY